MTSERDVLRVLGPVQVARAGRRLDIGGPKPMLLLAILVSRAGDTVPMDALIDGLWDDDPPATARKAVQVHVSNLRRALGDGFPLATTAGGYVLDPAEVAIDARAFEACLAEAVETLDEDPSATVDLTREALGMWTGTAYSGVSDAPALHGEVVRLTEERLRAKAVQFDARLRLGQHAAVVGELDAIATEQPYVEEFRRLHMLALYRSGRQTDALRSYQRTRDRLVDELGLEPSSELRSLHQQILEQAPELDLPRISTIQAAPSTPSQRGPVGVGDSVRGFELRTVIGTGQSSTVYRAYQPSIGREVAVEVIGPDVANHPLFVQHFEADMRRAAQLEHPHLVGLLDSWREPDGAYVVMPWIRRGSVADALTSGRWDPPATMRLLEQVGSAIAYLHRQGLSHGSIEPRFVLLDDDGNAYLSDAGRSWKRTVGDATASGFTAPEVLAGCIAGRPADVYAFGVLAHHLLTGHDPVPGEPLPAVMWLRSDLPPGIDGLVATATDPDPRQRPERVEDVSRALRQLFGADVTTRVGTAVDVEIRNPYKGLRAFTELDADDYVGREDMVDRVRGSVDTARLTVVVGPSGSGKSSLVKAGVLPIIRNDGVAGRPVLITEMYPGRYPFEELESALLRVAVDRPSGLLADLAADDRGMLRVVKQILPDDDSELLLVIDQFEELFSLTTDESVRRNFLDSLVTIAADERSRVRIVATIRADFFDHPLEHPAFGEMMSTGLVTVSMPGQSDLARAIAEPAGAVGLELEPGLIPIITRDVADEPGALPLLQYALTELTEARDGRLLTVTAYERTGGVVGALSRRAEEIFLALPPLAQEAAEELFVQLVAVDDESDDTRRRVRRSELDTIGVSANAMASAIDDFGSFRLLTFDHDPVTRGQTVEVAHEALMRDWPRYRSWIDERRDDLVLQRRLQVAAADWESSGRDPSFLLGGGRLEQYEQWAETAHLRLGDPERQFLDHSRERAADAKVSASRRRHRLTAGFAVLAALAVGVATVAVVQRSRADQAASVAETAAAEADLQRSAAEQATAEADALRGSAEQRALVDGARAAGLAAVELAGDEPETAVLVGLEAAAMAEEAGASLPEVVRGLWAGAISQQRIRARFEVGRQAFSQFGQGVNVSPDGRLGVSTLAVEQASETAGLLDAEVRTVWNSTTTVTDLATGAVVSTLGDDGLPLYSTWDPTTGEVVTANGEGSVVWWDPQRGVPVRREEFTSGPLWFVVLSADRLATSENIDQSTGESVAVLRDRSTMQPIAEVPQSLWSTLSPNGRWWATLSMSSEIVFHDARTGVEVARTRHRRPPQEAVASADWSANDDVMWFRRRDGSTLARIDLGGAEAPVVVTEMRLGAELSDGTQMLRTSPSGEFIALSNAEHRVFVVDADTGEQVVAFAGHAAAIGSLDWLPDGSGVVTVDASGTALVWDIGWASPTSMSSVRVAGFPSTHAQFADGSVLAADRSASGSLIDTVTGQTIVEFSPADTSRDLNVVANEAAGVFVAPSDGGLRLYDVGERRWTFEFSDIEGLDHPLAFSADGTRLLAGSAPSSEAAQAPATVMFDTTTGDVLWRIDQYLPGVAVITDDVVLVTRITTQGLTNRLAVLDVETGEELAASTRTWTTSAMTVSPDGKHLATVRDGAGIIIYALDALVERSKARAVATTMPDSATDLRDETIVQLAYSPDGSLLFSGSDGGILRAWDADTLEERWSIDNGISMAGLRVDGGRVWFGQPIGGDGVGGGGFGLAAIPFDQASIADWAATTVSRDLTERECREFLGRSCAARGGQP